MAQDLCALLPLCGGLIFRPTTPSAGRMATSAPRTSGLSLTYVMVTVSLAERCPPTLLGCLLINKFLILMLSLSAFSPYGLYFWVLCKLSLPNPRWRKYSPFLSFRCYCFTTFMSIICSAFLLVSWWFCRARVEDHWLRWCWILPRVPGTVTVRGCLLTQKKQPVW